ncbi:MAG: esterase/lipase family protein [Trichloromonadaceae bacterium]
MANQHAPYHPVIYVRGFAGTQGEIEDTVADPYMGFNIGSTKSRRVWDGTMRRFFFESPLVRLKDEIVWNRTEKKLVRSDRRYDDVYVDGEDLTAPDPHDLTKPLRSDITLPYQSIVIFRYYDDASTDFGTGTEHPIEHFARNLSNLILRLRTLVCRTGGKDPITGDPLDNGVAAEDFRVYLVAHSMGGLVCRAFLQNGNLGDVEARKAVDKVFTYATPHNGIDLRIVRNVPGWAALGEATNFNRNRMIGYFDLPQTVKDASEVKNFSADRIFNLVGTNPADYLALKGLSSWAVGEVSDGLVRIDNATTFGKDISGKVVQSPRAFAYRSHSGQYGIVNSEEGYQNLTRFLFGSVRVDGLLDINNVTLPIEMQKEYDNGRKVRASYKVEVVATVRGCQWNMHRRTVRENSAIQRTYDELFPADENGKRQPSQDRSPHLFSVFLDPTKSLNAKSKSVAFSFDLAVLVPDYEVDGVLWLNRHFEGGYIYRELILVEATPDAKLPGGWKLSYGYQSETPNLAGRKANILPLNGGGLTFSIPVESKPNRHPSITAILRVELRNWN